LRERRAKRGRKGRGLRRQRYHRDWREPRQLVLYRQAAPGESKADQPPPIYDATLSDHEGAIWLLKRYLKAIDVTVLERVVVCGDGAAWIWKDIERLCQRGELPASRVVQVLDYTHAKQNLNELYDLLPARVRQEPGLAVRWKRWLWEGDMDAIRQSLCRYLRGKKRAQGLKKWEGFFQRHAHRMRYAQFHAEGLPCGSGAVESAIRRVINLRLKGPGIFWGRERAEWMLFLRSQLLCGRWELLLAHLARVQAEPLRAYLAGQGEAANDGDDAPGSRPANVA